MAKTRLNKNHRRMLRRRLEDCDMAPKEQKAADKTYARAAALVRADFDKAYPPEDMALLRKYEVARKDQCIRGATSEGRFIGFEFRHDDDLTPWAPARYCRSRSIPFNTKTLDAIEKAEVAKDALIKAQKEVRDLYHPLINSVRYFEDVVEVWPAAEQWRSRICGQSTAVSTLSEDAIEKIRKLNLSPAQEMEAA